MTELPVVENIHIFGNQKCQKCSVRVEETHMEHVVFPLEQGLRVRCRK